MYDIDKVINRLEDVRNDIAKPILEELERLTHMLILAYKNEDGPAYTALIVHQSFLYKELQRKTQNLDEQLMILYRVKEICLLHES